MEILSEEIYNKVMSCNSLKGITYIDNPLSGRAVRYIISYVKASNCDNVVESIKYNVEVLYLLLNSYVINPQLLYEEKSKIFYIDKVDINAERFFKYQFGEIEANPKFTALPYTDTKTLAENIIWGSYSQAVSFADGIYSFAEDLDNLLREFRPDGLSRFIITSPKYTGDLDTDNFTLHYISNFFKDKAVYGICNSLWELPITFAYMPFLIKDGMILGNYDIRVVKPEYLRVVSL